MMHRVLLLALLLSSYSALRNKFSAYFKPPTSRRQTFLKSSSELGATDNKLTSAENIDSSLGSSESNGNDVLDKLRGELEQLRGTPELVDLLETYISKYPGLELSMDLYRALYPFKLDAFQEQGLTELMSGSNVVVTTPTGSGKTLVGELAIYFALMMGLRVAYTTPLKALSNQKFQDFTARYGGDRVGLLTGDVAINRGAAVTVMTTEVFRNMVYGSDSENQLSNLFMVVFDEFHYMNDPERGTVWEESVISCPQSVRILALSATMGNVADIQGWLQAIHGPTKLVASEYRPVPLRYFFGMKQGLFPLFRNPNAGPGALAGVQRVSVDEKARMEAAQNLDNGNKKGGFDRKPAKRGGSLQLVPGCEMNPTIAKFEDQLLKASKQAAAVARGGGRINGVGRPFRAPKITPHSLIPKYSDLVRELHSLQKVPAIVFVFSRAGCGQAAKMVMQGSTKLLNPGELQLVNAAVVRFVKENPDIPVDKQSVRMLRAGVGVHHAGLITVWKAFIEDLFNANLIKVLFATETLAAGVNMPARTTVISTVTKRFNSQVIKLKTSQLLQMAGRAGRRGKDTEGSVIILRNRFEDARLGHRILLAPIDDIKSHFRTSYGLAVKMLETRSLEECRQLIERGFGSYLVQKKRQKRRRQLEKQHKKEGITTNDLDNYRMVLGKYELQGCREFLKLNRRLVKERRNLDFLIERMVQSEVELVQAIADYMPMGMGLVLRSGEQGFFLGDVKWGDDNRHSGLGVLTKDLRILVAQKEHIRTFAETSDSLSPPTAQTLLDLFSMAHDWHNLPKDPNIDGIKKPVLEGQADMNKAWKNEDLAAAMRQVQQSTAVPEVPLPGSVVRQQTIVDNLSQQLQEHPVSQAGDAEAQLVIEALSYAAKQKDPVRFFNNLMQNNINDDDDRNAEDRIDGLLAGAKSSSNSSSSSDAGRVGDMYAWRMFQNVYALLQNFNALNGTEATELGEMVGSLTADNELWLALVLNHPTVQELRDVELAALMSGMVLDGYKASNAYFQNSPSDKLKELFDELLPLSWELKSEQDAAGIDFPVNLCVEAAGLVESWANGTSWRDLCKETSLDQGDVCRVLRRTMEILRQIPNAYGIPFGIAQLAYDAIVKMDRFPVSDTVDAAAAAAAAQKVAADEARKTLAVGGAGVGFEFSALRSTATTDATVVDESTLSNTTILDGDRDSSSTDVEDGLFDAIVDDDAAAADDNADVDINELDLLIDSDSEDILAGITADTDIDFDDLDEVDASLLDLLLEVGDSETSNSSEHEDGDGAAGGD